MQLLFVGKIKESNLAYDTANVFFSKRSVCKDMGLVKSWLLNILLLQNVKLVKLAKFLLHNEGSFHFLSR